MADHRPLALYFMALPAQFMLPAFDLAAAEYYGRSFGGVEADPGMLVERLLDQRLARSDGEEHFSKEHHADAI